MAELHLSAAAMPSARWPGAQQRSIWRLNAASSANVQYQERPLQPGWVMQMHSSGPTSHLAQRYHDAAKLRRKHNYHPQYDQLPLLPQKHQQQTDLQHQQRQQQQRQHADSQHQQQQQQQLLHRQSPNGQRAAASNVATRSSGLDAAKQPRAEQQPPQQQQQQQRRLRLLPAGTAASAFSQWLSFCDLYARSESAVDWRRAAHGMESLVAAASGPLQAQQAWQVAVLLQQQPLHTTAARRLGGTVVSLMELTLRNHDHSLLRQLMGHSPRFSFSSRHVHRLISAAAAADVGLEELQVLLDMLPQRCLSSRMFFGLIQSFVQRQQYPEAAHCFHKMQAAGLRMSPALQDLHQHLQLKLRTRGGGGGGGGGAAVGSRAG